MFHHVQLACPPGSEDTLRSYYIGVLGMTEKPKPPALAVRGGCWFVDQFGSELHLGVEQDFRPARKAHPALIRPDLDELAARLDRAGYPVVWGNDEVPGMRQVGTAVSQRHGGPAVSAAAPVRFHTEDCHGNRLEFVMA